MKELPEGLECRLGKVPDTLAYHQDHPEVTFGQYVMSWRQKFAKQNKDLIKIYLDQKYWIYFRNVWLSGNKEQIHYRIFNALAKLVESGKAICPVSCSVLIETMKQTDPSSRKATAEIIDILSKSIAIQYPKDLTVCEMWYYLHSLNTESIVDFSMYPVMIPSSYALGVCTPHSNAFQQEDMQAIQKAFFDTMASLSFSDLITCLKDTDSVPPYGDGSRHVEMLNTMEELHCNVHSDYNSLYLCEIRGVLDIEERFLFDAARGWEHNYRCSPFPWGIVTTPGSLGKLLHRLYKRKILSFELPGIYIGALIHAYRRWQRQKARKGDMYDLFHSRSALPYCSFFFTDRAWGNLLTRVVPPSESTRTLPETYGCKILWQDEAILDELNALL